MKKVAKSLFFGVLLVLTTGCFRSERKPNVIVLLLDTLRADHLSVHGYERETSPTLDAFAKENLWAKHAISAAPWTPASVASILTGMYPVSHRMMPPNDRTEARKSSAVLDDRLETLTKILKQAGYQTGGVSSNPWITKVFKFDQSFDSFKEIMRAPATQLTDAGIKLIDRLRAADDPFYAYLHYLDPHDPYDPPEQYRELFKGPLTARPVSYDQDRLDNLGLYDGEIRYLDDQLARLFQYLKEKKLWDNTVIVIVGDHGEQFMEHGDRRHGYKLHNEELHVPLMIRTPRPADRGRIIEQTVSTIDILPTVLELVGLPRPARAQGVSLLDDGALAKRPPMLSEIRRHYDYKSITTTGGTKLIMTVDFIKNKIDAVESEERWKEPKFFGVFERDTDYYEVNPDNDAQKHESLIKAFKEIYSAAESNQVSSAGATTEVSEETLRELESLGYMN